MTCWTSWMGSSTLVWKRSLLHPAEPKATIGIRAAPLSGLLQTWTQTLIHCWHNSRPPPLQSRIPTSATVLSPAALGRFRRKHHRPSCRLDLSPFQAAQMTIQRQGARGVLSCLALLRSMPAPLFCTVSKAANVAFTVGDATSVTFGCYASPTRSGNPVLITCV